MTNSPLLGERSRPAVLLAATQVLVQAPHTSLNDLAAVLGIGRTTLHRMFPTRADLLAAIAHDAIDHLGAVYTDAGLRDGLQGAQALAALHRLVTLLIPLGPSLMFLLRAAELDGDQDLARRIDQLDQPLRHAVGLAQTEGALQADIPDWWAAETLFALIYTAWEQIQRGRLAPLAADTLVLRSWMHGVSTSPPP